MAQSTILMSTLASQAAGGGKLTVDQSDALTVSTASNVSVLRNTSSSTTVIPDGSYNWVIVVDGASSDAGLGVTYDNQGNVYATGTYTQSVSVRNSSGNTLATLPAVTTVGAYLLKLTTAGMYQWGVVVDSSGTVSSRRVATDEQGSAYVTGWYSGSSTIRNASGVIMTSLPTFSQTTGVLIKVNSSGVFQWSRTMGGNGNSFGNDVTLDTSGFVYMAGTYGSSGNIYNTSGAILTTLPGYTSGGTGVLVRFDSNGGLHWFVTLIGPTGNNATFTGVTTDIQGNVCGVGNYTSAANVRNPSGNVVATLASANSDGAFIAEFGAANGNFLWANTLDGNFGDYFRGVGTDAFGNIYACGTYDTSATIRNLSGIALAQLPNGGPGNTGFTVKFNGSGTYQWVVSIDGVSFWDQVNGLAVEPQGNIYISGSYDTSGAIRNTSGVIVATLPTLSSSTRGALIMKMSTSGTPLWMNTVDGQGEDSANAVAYDGTSNVCATGTYVQSVPTSFRNSSGTTLATFPTVIGSSAYILSMTSGGTLTNNPAYALLSTLTSANNGFQKLLYHAPNSNAATATVNVTNPSGSTINTYTIGQGSNVNLIWYDNQWLRL